MHSEGDDLITPVWIVFSVLSWTAASAVPVAPNSRFSSQHLRIQTVIKPEATPR